MMSDLKAFERFLDATIDGALDFKKLTDEDRSELEWAKKNLRGVIDNLEKLISQLPYEHVREHGLTEVTRALGIAFTVGHAGSVSESSGNFVSAIRGSRGGKISAESRKVRPWMGHAEELIKDYVAANPNASQDDIATDVAAGWKLKDVRAPGHSTLKIHVAQMQKDKRIQRPVR